MMNEKNLKDMLPFENSTYYGKGGNIVEESQCFCKLTEVTERGNTKSYYFIWLYRGNLFDPYGPDILKRSDRTISKYVKVSKEIFDNYFKYLKCKNSAFYNLASRNYRGR